MATKAKEATVIDHPGLGETISMLQGQRKLKKIVVDREEELSGEAKDLMEEFGVGSYQVEDFKFSYLQGRRTSVNKDMLLEAGVLPEIVERCTVETTYRYIGTIK